MSLASESEPSESSARVQDSKLNAIVTETHTEHIFARHGRRGGPREVWRKQSRLGHGAFGTVWLEKCEQPYRRDTPPLRAVKEIHLQSRSNSRVDYTRELDAFAKFSQPKVNCLTYIRCKAKRDSQRQYEPYFVRSFGWYATNDSVFITLAYHPFGDLSQYLTAPLPEVEAKQIAEQLLEGVKHMHDSGFAHRDLKPKAGHPERIWQIIGLTVQNVLVVSKGPSWRVQITDFGISKKIQDGHTAQGTLYQGTSGFMAPEMIVRSLSGPPYAIDMWSLGAMAYYILTHRIFLPEIADLFEYGTGDEETPSCIYTGLDVTSRAQDFVARLLARLPQARPTADEALSTEWMASLERYGYVTERSEEADKPQ
jgi:serine/threonine protein kinase